MNVIRFKEAKCKNCYKCVRVCDVKAIAVKNEQAQIMNDHCILCGHCLAACPQNAKSLVSDIDRVKDFLKSGLKTVISIAPSFAGIMDYKKPGQLVAALKCLGFYQVRETAEGAAYVTAEYLKLLEEGRMDNVITTCCPSVNDLMEIYYPELTDSMAPVVSPMVAHGRLLKKELGSDIRVVFLGPCIAKKREAENDLRVQGAVDAVLNFAELEKWLAEEGIDLKTLDELPFDNKNPEINRLYPVNSGVINAVLASRVKDKGYQKLAVDGVRNCMDFLESMKKGEIHNVFVEMNTCVGGCINGPAVECKEEKTSYFKRKLDMEAGIEKIPAEIVPLEETGINLSKIFVNRSFHDELPSEEKIRETLAKIGKTDKSHELNCGACGYPTCRDKAIAVCQGKAELTMCIPYMHEKAQSMANIVLDTTPNIIIVVDSDMKILEFSRGAEMVFGKSKQEAIGMYLFEFIDHRDFDEVLNSQSKLVAKRVSYQEYDITTLQTIVYVKEINGVLGVFQDISNEAEKNRQAYKLKMDTIEMAQRVIDKQMMVAQEIAGLLGETTAETKVTLTKLRDMIVSDGEFN
ncbi:MAG: [Fe-Fe] hydrogenase large subunit C-terminal domain-containing protein [Acetivibrio ethanolgignens]